MIIEGGKEEEDQASQTSPLTQCGRIVNAFQPHILKDEGPVEEESMINQAGLVGGK